MSAERQPSAALHSLEHKGGLNGSLHAPVAWGERRIVVAGAGPIGGGTPWGTIAEIMKGLLGRAGYPVEIETASTGMNNIRYVHSGRAAFGATNLGHLLQAYRGINDWAAEGRQERLRIVANINHPAWLAIAVRSELQITELGQAIDKELPLRVRVGVGRLTALVLSYYGITADRLAALGGSLRGIHDYEHEEVDLGSITAQSFRRTPWVDSGDFDVIIDGLYTGYTPEIRYFAEAGILHELRFLPVPEAVVCEIEAEGLGTRSFLPHKMLRGAFFDVPSVSRLPQAIYVRDDAPDDFVEALLDAVDHGHAEFRMSHLALSIDPENVASDHGVPFHRAAIAHYERARREEGKAARRSHGERLSPGTPRARGLTG